MIILFRNFVKVGSLDTEIAVLEVLESKLFFAPKPWWGHFCGQFIMSNLLLMDLGNLAGLQAYQSSIGNFIYGFAPRPLIFKLQHKVLKFNDIYSNWSSTDKRFELVLVLRMSVFLNSNFKLMFDIPLLRLQ